MKSAIIAYCSQLRAEHLYNLEMEHARLMLYDDGRNVSEFAPVVG